MGTTDYALSEYLRQQKPEKKEEEFRNDIQDVCPEALGTAKILLSSSGYGIKGLWHKNYEILLSGWLFFLFYYLDICF